MFTGIVGEVGTVIVKEKIPEGFLFRIKSNSVNKKLKASSSVCVNGACHTVTKKSKDWLEVNSIHETLKKTNFGELKIGSKVNLESSLRLGDEIGGHFVTGHIDTTGTIEKIIKRGKDKSLNWDFVIKAGKKFSVNVIFVGSVAVNGVSLTVAEINKPSGKSFTFKVSIIPFTFKHTNFIGLKTGSKVNLEFDHLGKYILKSFKI